MPATHIAPAHVGHVGTVADDCQRITGVAPQPFAAWLTAHRAQLQPR